MTRILLREEVAALVDRPKQPWVQVRNTHSTSLNAVIAVIILEGFCVPYVLFFLPLWCLRLFFSSLQTRKRRTTELLH